MARNAFRVVADPLDFEIELDRTVGETHRLGDRLLAHDKFETEPIDLLFLLIDILVAKDDRIGQLPVIFDKRFHAIVQGHFGPIGHLDDIFADTIDISLERFL